MAFKHNKKRNSGMVSEFFAMYIAEAVVSRKYGTADVAKKLLKKHACPGSELAKEMHLFEAVLGRHFESKALAYDMLSKVKQSARTLKREKLDREKTALIREIVSTFDSGAFFGKDVKNYTQQASLQILLNYCSSKTFRESVINPAMAELEDKVLSHMCAPTNAEVAGAQQRTLAETMEMTQGEVDGLVVSIMREKMNKKYGPRLTDDQKTILQEFVFGNDVDRLKKTLSSLRDDTLHLITEELADKPTAPERDRLTEIEGLLKEDFSDISVLDDDTITFYMTVSKLNEELKDEK